MRLFRIGTTFFISKKLSFINLFSSSIILIPFHLKNTARSKT